MSDFLTKSDNRDNRFDQWNNILPNFKIIVHNVITTDMKHF